MFCILSMYQCSQSLHQRMLRFLHHSQSVIHIAHLEATFCVFQPPRWPRMSLHGALELEQLPFVRSHRLSGGIIAGRMSQYLGLNEVGYESTGSELVFSGLHELRFSNHGVRFANAGRVSLCRSSI